MLVSKHIPARNCILSNWIVGCMRVKCLMLLLYAEVVQGLRENGKYKRMLNPRKLRNSWKSGFNSIETYHSINNPASGKVMQKSGMFV